MTTKPLSKKRISEIRRWNKKWNDFFENSPDERDEYFDLDVALSHSQALLNEIDRLKRLVVGGDGGVH